MKSHAVIDASHNAARSGGGIGGGLAGLGVVIAGAAMAAKSYSRATEIEVTRDAVIIDGKAYRRGDFGGFRINRTFNPGNVAVTLAELGFSYGRQTFPLGGALSEKQAMEIASALNEYLRQSPQEGDEQQPSADQLRGARPSDF